MYTFYLIIIIIIEFAKKGDVAYRAPTGASRGGTGYGKPQPQ
jgi:hypothetical protein